MRSCVLATLSCVIMVLSSLRASGEPEKTVPWAWFRMVSQDNKWSLAEGVAKVDISENKIKIVLLRKDGTIFDSYHGICNITKTNIEINETRRSCYVASGQVELEAKDLKPNQYNVEWVHIAFKSDDDQVFSPDAHRDIININDDYNIIGLTNQVN